MNTPAPHHGPEGWAAGVGTAKIHRFFYLMPRPRSMRRPAFSSEGTVGFGGTAGGRDRGPTCARSETIPTMRSFPKPRPPPRGTASPPPGPGLGPRAAGRGAGSPSVEGEWRNLALGGFGLAGVAAPIRASSPPEIGGRPVRAVGSCGLDVAGAIVVWGLVARSTLRDNPGDRRSRGDHGYGPQRGTEAAQGRIGRGRRMESASEGGRGDSSSP